MTTALLERSGNTPVVATYVTPNPNALVPSAEVLLPHLDRIKKVHVDASLEQLMEFLSCFSGHSSTLEAVEIQGNFVDIDIEEDDDEYEDEDEDKGEDKDEDEGEGEDEDEAVSERNEDGLNVVKFQWETGDSDIPDMWREMFVLPPMFKHSPNLTFLRARNVPFSDSFLELHHLTHLELSHTNPWSPDNLAILLVNPKLEVVILRGDRSWGRGTYGVEPDEISLPRLRRLELYHIPPDRALEEFTFPPGAHFSCIDPDGYTIPGFTRGLLDIFTVEKMRFAFSKRQDCISRAISGSSTNGTFLLTDTVPRLDLDINEIPLSSLEELSISFADTGAGEGSPNLTFVDVHGYFLGLNFPSYNNLRVLILQRVNGCEIILRLLCDPRMCPKLNTIALANVRSHTTYWTSLVEMARVRDQHVASSNIVRVDVGCRAGEPPESDQLEELRTYVFAVKIKPWNYVVEELDWLNDPRFRNLGRL